MAGYSKQYRENRLRVLAGNPICVLCNKRPATQADHIIPKAHGGDDTMENLRPSCAKCNTSRGARQGNTDRAKMQRARNAAAASSAARRPDVFGGNLADPDALLPVISPETAPKGRGRSRSAPEPHRTACIEPRLVTASMGGNNYGAQIAAWAQRHLNTTLMPWQLQVLEGMTEHDPDTGRWHRRLALVSVARQNGKTMALRALVGWWLTEGPLVRGGPQTVITTAHALDLAVALFQDLAPILEEYYGGKPKWSYGRNEMKMPDGSLWLIRAATSSAGHGRSPDLIVADEVWDISEEAIDQGLMPSQRARKNPLLAMWSTAGTEASSVMLRYREQGIKAVDDGGGGPLYFCEFSPAPGVDLSVPENWLAANPAIGHTLDLETLVAESKTPNRAAFLRASLNLWVSNDTPWIQPGVWDALLTDKPPRPPAVLAVDSSHDGTRYAGVLAELDEHGSVVVSVGFQTSSVQAMWVEVKRLLPPTAVLAFTPPLEVTMPPDLRGSGRTTMVGYAELVKWTALVRQMMMDGRIWHRGEEALGDHIARAVAVNTANGLVLSSKKSAGPIELARLMIFAAALAARPKQQGRPAFAVAQRR